MPLTRQYLEDHARSASERKGTDTSDYESFGRAVAALIMKESANSKELDKGDVKELKLTGTTISVSENASLACVEIEICLPFIGCSKAHVGI